MPPTAPVAVHPLTLLNGGKPLFGPGSGRGRKKYVPHFSFTLGLALICLQGFGFFRVILVERGCKQIFLEIVCLCAAMHVC